MRPTVITLGVRLEDSISFAVDGVPTDPGSITLKYRRYGDVTSEITVDLPDPLNPIPPVERLGVGSYRALLDLDQVGDWRIRWESTDPARAASDRRVLVETLYPTA